MDQANFWETGQIGSNDEAVAFVQNHAFGGIDFDIVPRALHCRNQDKSRNLSFPNG
jgi:hypothetical protein